MMAGLGIYPKTLEKMKSVPTSDRFYATRPHRTEFIFFEFIPKASNIIKQEENPCARVPIFQKTAIKLVKILENPFSTMYK